MSTIPIPWRVTRRPTPEADTLKLARRAALPFIERVYTIMALAPLPGLWTPEVLAARLDASIDETDSVLRTLARAGRVEVDPAPALRALEFLARSVGPAARSEAIVDAVRVLRELNAAGPFCTPMMAIADRLEAGAIDEIEAHAALSGGVS